MRSEATAAPADQGIESPAGQSDEVAEPSDEPIADPAINDDEDVVDTGDTAKAAQNAAGTETTSASGDTEVEQAQEATIKVYYTDPEIMELKESNTSIKYTDEEDKFKQAFAGLQMSSEADLNPLWSDEITLNSISFDQGALTLDITKPAEANLGAGGEMFAIEALQKTFFQFDEVKSLELLVEGQQIESLMGHVELEHPMTRGE